MGQGVAMGRVQGVAMGESGCGNRGLSVCGKVAVGQGDEGSGCGVKEEGFVVTM